MTETYFEQEVVLNENYNNAAIKVHLLDEAKMREIGFTDFRPSTWYFCKCNVGHPDISFSLSIEKNNPDKWRIDVLDENFLQPYDYQMMIEKGTTNPIPKRVQEKVEYWMEYLKDNGIIEGHNYGDYI